MNSHVTQTSVRTWQDGQPHYSGEKCKAKPRETSPPSASATEGNVDGTAIGQGWVAKWKRTWQSLQMSPSTDVESSATCPRQSRSDRTPSKGAIHAGCFSATLETDSLQGPREETRVRAQVVPASSFGLRPPKVPC